jgi:hypothetical protein
MPRRHKHRRRHWPPGFVRRFHARLHWIDRRHHMANVKLTWVDPTVLADGTTPLPAGDLAFIQISRSADGVTFAPLAQVQPGVQEYLDASPAPASYIYQAVAVDTQTPAESSAAVTVSIVVPVPAIQAPGPVTAFAAALA